MTSAQKITPGQRETIRKLYALGKGKRFIYHNSRSGAKPSAVFKVARDLSDKGRIQINQRRDGHGGVDYLATGLWSDLDKKRNGE